jgi:6-phosphogluconolactonase/glucosamine-6-phosphate isomerase/deaminase
MDKLRIFISSTIRDLTDERSLLRLTLDGAKYFHVFISESGTGYGSSCDVCMKEIENCDIFVLIIGEKYGYIPKEDLSHKTPYDGRISATKGEFLKARSLQKPILVFAKEGVSREKKEEMFFRELSEFIDGEFLTRFSTKEDLGVRLHDDLSKLLADMIRNKYKPLWKRSHNVIIAKTPIEVAQIAAKILGRTIQERPYANIGLFAGKTASLLYQEFFSMFNKESMENIKFTKFYSVTEHFGISPENPLSYYHWLEEAFFCRAKERWNIEIPESNKKLVPSMIKGGTLESFKLAYDEELSIERVQVQFMSPAPDGQFISIDPNIYVDADELAEMGTSIVKYSEKTAKYLMPRAPHNRDIIIGMRNILNRSERLVILAYGSKKRRIVRQMILGPVEGSTPASLVSRFPHEKNLLFIIDNESSKELPNKNDLGRYANIIEPNSLDDWLEKEWGFRNGSS